MGTENIDKEEIEVEKDYTTLFEPMKEYHKKLLATVISFKDDIDELTKIRERIEKDADSLISQKEKLKAYISYLVETHKQKQAFEKYNSECVELLERAEMKVGKE